MKKKGLLVLMVTGLFAVLTIISANAAEPLMIKDLEDAHITTTRCPWEGYCYISANSGLRPNITWLGLVDDNQNIFVDLDVATIQDRLWLSIDYQEDPTQGVYQAGDTIELTYDGGQTIAVCLPEISTWLDLYVATDGSTYYDEALTQLAQAPPPPLGIPYTEDFTTDTYKDAGKTTADWNTTDGEGKLVGYEDRLVNTYTTNCQYNPSIATRSDGTFVITWDSYGQDGSRSGIYAQLFNADGSKLGNEFQVNTYTYKEQCHPSIATRSDNSFIITWTSYSQDGSKGGIYAQMFDTDGTKLGDEFRVNTYTTNTQREPSVATRPDDTFVITWESCGQGSHWSVYAQLFNTDGSKLGDEFQVNTLTTGVGWQVEREPSVATRPDGTFVITWTSRNDDVSNDGIYAQLFNADGSKLGDEFQVNTYTARDQIKPSIATRFDGTFVITWENSGQDAPRGRGIYAQLFNADGTKLGDEFQVNTYTTGNQWYPSIATRSDGTFIITWQSGSEDTGSEGQDGDNGGIYAQLFNADGSTLGDEFQVNTYTTDDQWYPSTATRPDGTFVITWQSFCQYGSSGGVYLKRYSENGSVLTPKFYRTRYGNILQSTTISREPVSGIILTADDNIPDGASVTYYLSNGGGMSVCAQNPYNEGIREEYEIEMDDSSQYFGQSFVAEHDSFNQVSFCLRYFGADEPTWGELKIYASEDDLINDTNAIAIADFSPELNADNVYERDRGSLFTVEFDSPISVTTGETYYFALRPSSWIYFTGDYDSTENTYPNGKIYNSEETMIGDFFFKVGQGRVWDEVTPGEYHEFSDPTGTDIRWKAVLGEATDTTETPIIYSITIVGKLAPDKELEALLTTIEEMGIPQQIEGSLETKLETALDKVLIAQADIEDGDIEHAENMADAAINKINAFINQVEAQLGKKITEEDATKLIEAAQSLITNIESLVAEH